MKLRPFLVSALLCGLASTLPGTVRLPAIFGSHMVLQAGQPVPVWGWAVPGERITVAVAGHSAACVAGADGTWQIALPALRAGLVTTLTVTGDNRIELEDVLTGEVWLCSGQSNMGFRLNQAEQAEAEIAAASCPSLRLFTVKRAVNESGPSVDCRGEWVVCQPRTAAEFSAVAYFMGRRLVATLGCPVGLIHSSWGGTRAEAWTPKANLAADPELAPIVERWAEEMRDFPQRRAAFAVEEPKLRAQWSREVEAAKAAGRMPPSEPKLRTGPNTQYAPSGLYNAMIAPLIPFAIRGVAWYQGEANAQRAEQYRRLFPAMVEAWRMAWGRDLPFVYVQLPNLARQPEPSQSGWAELREAQALTLALPHTAMAVTIDVGDPHNLHPKSKRPVGIRLAQAAESLAYHLPAPTRLSPVYQGCRFEPDGRVRIHFAPGHGGLKSRDGGPLAGFAIAGSDRQFVPAEARLENGAVVVQCTEVPKPEAVRYAWADNPVEANLVSSAGLPASPFRTDDWPAVTTGRR